MITQDTSIINDQSYATTCDTYQQKTDKKLANSDMLILAGFGAGLRVERDALVVRNGLTHTSLNATTPTQNITTLYRGTHSISHICILSDSGTLSLDAIRWCQSQNIAISILDRNGSLVQTLTTEHQASAQLRRLQYLAEPSHLSYEIVKLKTESQISLLQAHPELPQQKRALEILETSMKWLELPDLTRWSDTPYIMTFEGRGSAAYFEAWNGLPLKWNKADAKTIPPHWQSVSPRSSPLSHNHGARHATNPCHAILNYAYAMLESQCLQALNLNGFDTSCAFLHADKVGRNSLVYDLMDMGLRSQVDHLVLQLLSSTTFKKGMLIPTSTGQVRLNPQFASFVCATCQLPANIVQQAAKTLKSWLLT